MTQEYYAHVDYTFNGSTTTYSVPFSYIDKSHVAVIINGDNDNPITNLNFTTSSQITLDVSGLTAGDIISIVRTTPLDERIVQFTDGNILDEETQNLSADQVFNAVQEVTDSQDSLIAKMDEFIKLKSYVDSLLANITKALNTIDVATQYNEQTMTLVNDIANTFETLQAQVAEGIKSSVTHNLFDCIFTDKTLSATESIGLAAAGETVKAEDYPTAYQTLLDEYNNGTAKVYEDDDVVTSYKSYTGETTGTFYIAASSTIAADVTIYSDTSLTTSIGVVKAVETTTTNKFKYGTNSYFYSTQTLATGVNVYSNEACSTLLGVITGLKETLVNKYTFSTTGAVYIDSDLNLRVGRILYSDVALSVQAGTITKMTSISSDRYSVAGLSDIDSFYVPSGTVIGANTTIYSDAACLNAIGTITQKGTVTTSTVYCYTFDRGVYLGQGGSPRIRVPFYTKTPLGGNDIPIYQDNTCTIQDNYNGVYHTARSVGDGLARISVYGGIVAASGVRLISSSTASSSDYIVINNTQCTYYKQATVEANVVQINDGGNETYIIGDTSSHKCIKIGVDSYTAYENLGSISVYTVNILPTGESTQTHEKLTYNGIKTASGITFEYKEASNGHKIVNSIYKTVIQSLEEAPFYILDIETEKFTLPRLTTDEDINLYFCVGNTVTVHSSMRGVTKAELNSTLESYVKMDNDILTAISIIVSEYNSTVGNINTALTEIIGE